MRRLVCYSSIALITMVSGCAHHPTQSSAPSTAHMNPACQRDPLLMKYGCSVEHIEAMANQGNPDAQYALGYMYYYGINTIQDKDIATLWIERAAKQGQPLARQALKLIKPQITAMHDESATYPPHYPKGVVQKQPIVVRKKPAIQHPVLAHPLIANQQRASVMPREASDQVKSVSSASASSMATVTSMERSLLQAPASSYTLQLMGNHHLATLQSFVKANKLSSQAKIYAAKFDGGQWYMLVWGQFKSVEAAHAALKTLPKTVRDHQPWIKPMKDVHREIKTRRLAT